MRAGDLYRAGLVTAATSFVIAASTAILPDDFFLTNFLKQNLDVFYALGAGGLGLSLIHIYVTEIKRTLQALWGYWCSWVCSDIHTSSSACSWVCSDIQMLSNKTRRRLCGVPSDQRTKSSSLAAVVSANDDLLLEILLRLPVRSLLVFKSVSKRWLSLISDSYFVNNHCLRTCTPPTPGLFLLKSSSSRNPEYEFIFLDGKVTSVPFKFLNFVNDPGGISILQSCNGLLCCSSSSDRANASSRTYYVYNPSTKQYTTLPRSQNRETTTEEEVDALFEPQSRKDCLVYVCCINLAFDPLKSPHYKAICVLYLKEKDVYRIEIYSSETASWKLSGDAVPGYHGIFWNSGVFWNGSVHWMSFRSVSDPLYFDIDQELLKTMPIPSRPDNDDDLENWVTMYLGEFKGHLHLIEGRENQTTRFDILKMETDYSAWNVKYRVDLDTLITACPEMMFSDEVDNYFIFSILLLVVDEEEKELSSLVIRIPDKVISYNLKERTFKIIHDLSPGVHAVQLYWDNVYLYIESLACV